MATRPIPSLSRTGNATIGTFPIVPHECSHERRASDTRADAKETRRNPYSEPASERGPGAVRIRSGLAALVAIGIPDRLPIPPLRLGGAGSRRVIRASADVRTPLTPTWNEYPAGASAERIIPW